MSELEEGRTISELLQQFWKRKIAFFSIVLLGMSISVTVALVLPPVYESLARMLIEEQDIPTDLVRSTVTSYAAQRIQVIKQRIMTRSSLMEIIEKYDLYAEERRLKPTEQILEVMKNNIDIEMQSANVIDPRTGRATKATIAFTLGFKHDDPGMAQKVTNELVTLFQSENVKQMTSKVRETASFLDREAARLQVRVREVEAKIAEFKRNNFALLPEMERYNLQNISRFEADLASNRSEQVALGERFTFLQAQMRQIEREIRRSDAAGDGSDGDAYTVRLQALKQELVSLTSRYADTHPDVLRTQREIASLKASHQASGPVDEVTQREQELADLRARYSAEHPDVKRAERALQQAREQAAKVADAGDQAAKEQANTAVSEGLAGDQVYQSLITQAQALKNQQTRLKEDERSLLKGLRSAQDKLALSPKVEQGYQELNRDRANLLNRYRELRVKLMDAQVAKELEEDDKGQRFTLIEAPNLPGRPAEPNRIAIIMLGSVLSLAAAFALVVFLISLDQSIQSAAMLARVVGEPPLAVIRYIDSTMEDKKRRRRRWGGVLLFIVAVVVTVLCVHFFYKPLDTLWFMMQRKLQVLFV